MMIQQEQLTGISIFLGVTFVVTYPKIFTYTYEQLSLWGIAWVAVFAVLVLLYVMVYGGE